MFVKKEVNWMNRYLWDSNTAINNGYKMDVVTSLDENNLVGKPAKVTQIRTLKKKGSRENLILKIQ
jgi:predicted lipoprotein